MSVLERAPATVRIVEVAPRDGLQNEPRIVPAAAKAAFIADLAAAGHRHIEVTSFVRPDLVPQLADAEEVVRELDLRGIGPGRRRGGGGDAREIVLTALVMNERGLDRALAAGLRSIAVATAASDTFSRRNAGCDVRESLERIRRIARRALRHGVRLRAYISTAFTCPYEGEILPDAVAGVLVELLAAGIDSISIGDTTGAAHPASVDRLLEHLAGCLAPRRQGPPLAGLALHLHDTRRRALANVVVGLEYGIDEYDSSGGGLGGCPFAPGARGNLDTHTLVSMLHAMGIPTGIDLERHDRAVARLRAALDAAPPVPGRADPRATGGGKDGRNDGGAGAPGAAADQN